MDLSLPAPLEAYLRTNHISPARVIPLTGDASDRRYFRVHVADAAPFVLALYAAPFDARTLPFLNVAELFAAMPVPVPKVLGHSDAVGVLALEDLGDVTLQAQLGDSDAAAREALYARAVDHIVTIQTRGEALRSDRFVPYGLAFDADKLGWEMAFFVRHFLEHYRGVVLDPPVREALAAALTTLVNDLADLPRVLCHRDYHSRNLMVHDGDLFVIDFQDARLGPSTYDLASLLRDSYVDLPQTLVKALVASFAERIGRRDRDVFLDEFDLMALQRNLKALGTFGYQATARANPVYGQYVPRTLGYVRQNLERHARFQPLRTVLGEVVPELR